MKEARGNTPPSAAELFTEEADFPSMCCSGFLQKSLESQRELSAHLQGGVKDKHGHGV